MSIPITTGSGAASVAAEAVGGLQYQQVEVLGRGGSSTLGVNPDGSANVSVIGVPNVNVSGSVFATLSGSGSVIAVLKSSSIIGVVTGSVVAIPTGNQSISGTVDVGDIKQSIFGSSVIGWVPVQTSNTSVISYVQNSVAAVIIGGSIAATVTPADNQSVSGTVGASVIGHAPVVIVGGSILTSSTANQSVSGAVNVSGSVLLGSSNASVIAKLQDSSIIAIASGSVLSVPTGSVVTVWGKSPSIVGTYAEDAAHTVNDKGILTLGVRNDTLSSLTSADNDYSAHAVGPIGERIVANAPITKWVQGTADFRQGNAGASIVAIAAQGASIFTYITAVQVANMGSASVLVTLASTGSTLGYTIAPAGGGSNIYYPNALKTPANGTFAASISGIASVLVSAQGFTAKT